MSRPSPAAWGGMWVALGLAAFAPAGRAQQTPRFPAEAELVEIEVVVTDAKGAMVRGLRREDFVLLEDGRPQAISHFALRTAQRAEAAPAAPVAEAPPPLAPVEFRPRHLALVVDDLHLSPPNLLVAKTTLLRFVDEQLAPEDEAALVTTSGALGFLQQFTTDRVVLRRAIERLAPRARLEPSSAEKPQLTVYQADLIERNDREALAEAVAELLREDPLMTNQIATNIVQAKARAMVVESAHSTRTALATLESIVRGLQAMEGRKVLVLLSDGFYMGTAQGYDLRAITGAATRSAVVIYSLDTRGLTAVSPAGDATASVYSPSFAQERYRRLGLEADRDGMNALARDTGGVPVYNLNDLNLGLKRILDDTATYYLLAYEPSASPRDGRFHKIEVKVPGRRGLEVRTRKGYFAPADAASAATPAKGKGKTTSDPNAPSTRLREGLSALVPQQEVPVNLAVGYLDAPGRGPTAVVSAEVDLSRARFESDGDHHRATLELAGLVLDERGKVASSFGDRRELNLGEEAFQMALQEGFSFQTRAALKPGLHQIRVAVLEGGERLGTAARWIEIPDLAKKEFTVSDIFVTGQDEDLRPVWDGRAFPRDEAIEFVLFAYNPKADAELVADVLFETQILAGPDLLAAGNPQNIVVPVDEPQAGPVTFSRRLSLAGLAPGEYTLRLLVADRIARAKTERSLRFQVE